MFITLAMIFATALIATPVVAPAVRRFINAAPPEKGGRNSRGTLDQEQAEGDDRDDGLSDLARALAEIQEELYPEEIPLKVHQRSASSPSQTQPKSVRDASPAVSKRALIDVKWSGVELDAVEAARETRSADELFAESDTSRRSVREREKARAKQQAKQQTKLRREVIESPAESEELPPNQEAVVGIDKPDAARSPVPLVTRDPSEETKRSTLAEQGIVVDRIEHHHISSSRQKMRAVERPQRASSRPKTVIPLQVTQAPSAKPDLSRFEVLTPSPNQPRRTRAMSSTPEMVAVGERAWRGEQPLYINFDQLFSLDSLISIEDQALSTEGFPRMSRRNQRLSPRRRASARRRMRARRQRLKSRRARSRLMPTRAPAAFDASSDLELGSDILSGELSPLPMSDAELTDQGDASRAGDEDVSSLSREPDDALHDDELYDDELYPDPPLGEGPHVDHLGGGEGLGWERSMPEWRSLLGGGHLLAFNFKLNQRRASAHRALTESSLEDTLVLQISEGVTQPRVSSHRQERSREALDEATHDQ